MIFLISERGGRRLFPNNYLYCVEKLDIERSDKINFDVFLFIEK